MSTFANTTSADATSTGAVCDGTSFAPVNGCSTDITSTGAVCDGTSFAPVNGCSTDTTSADATSISADETSVVETSSSADVTSADDTEAVFEQYRPILNAIFGEHFCTTIQSGDVQRVIEIVNTRIATFNTSDTPDPIGQIQLVLDAFVEKPISLQIAENLRNGDINACVQILQTHSQQHPDNRALRLAAQVLDAARYGDVQAIVRLFAEQIEVFLTIIGIPYDTQFHTDIESAMEQVFYTHNFEPLLAVAGPVFEKLLTRK